MKNQLKIRGLIMATVMAFSLGFTHLDAQKLGEAAPDFEVDLLGGGSFKLSDQEGKVVFLFFFGNACSSCKSVGPTLESSIFQEFKGDEDFVALGLDTWDSSSGENSVSGFKNSTGITFPLAIKAGAVAAAYETAYDHLVVIDRDGNLVHKGTDGASNDVNNAISAIDASLMAAGLFSKSSGESGVRVWPVPAGDVVHFKSEETLGHINIYSAAGKLVLVDQEESLQGVFSHTLDVQTLRKGVYFYTIQRKDGIVSGKFLIQR